jgi:hypothetical protein
LLFVARPADEHEEAEVLPPCLDSMLDEEVVEVGEDFRFEGHAWGLRVKE